MYVKTALGKINDSLNYLSQPAPQTLDAIPKHLEGAVDGLLSQLDESVRRRVQDIPFHECVHMHAYRPSIAYSRCSARRSDNGVRVAILFSGGIDCTMLAYLADRY